MNINLTHEQADFDALASLLGAALIRPGSYSVLPARVNLNVQAFLDRYHVELPLVHIQDLPPDPVEEVTLVDTRAMISLRGMTLHTLVYVIDHHPIREPIDPAWECQIEPTGAATTLLVERLQRAKTDLSELQASLLLLGIYEDTGSLTYPSTTSRDAQAVAYLLDQKGDLRIVSEYLNPPLSTEQMRLYDSLLKNAHSFQMDHLNLVTACADGRGMAAEISSVAHALRDFLKPDGLFVLVATPDGYRFVMRSTCDQLNVAEIAAHFGGGGHARAAGALIKDPPGLPADTTTRMQEVMAELVEILAGYLRVPLTVGQIMSCRPRLIRADTQATEALALMQRYGYEGFPVVDGNRVLGLLTRRSVDRALAHKLNLKAASLMDAGQVQVFPADSLEHLQTVMSTSGWGQIPVVNPQNQEIVGIVTRTDFLKTIASRDKGRFQMNLKDLLEVILPTERLQMLQLISREAREQHTAAYIVGGFVRDLLLGYAGEDFDIVVEGDAVVFAMKLRERYGGRLVTHARFGTAKWYLKDIHPKADSQAGKDFSAAALPDSLDLITARTEFYEYPTALPTVERSSIQLDLHRRDFSINTLAIRLDGHYFGELLDFWGGYADLQSGIIRVLHSLSFIDDPTRMMRAVRFEQRFQFQIEQRTLDLMGEAGAQLEQVTGERLRHEFDSMFVEEYPWRSLDRMQQLGLLAHIHPDLCWQAQWAAGLEQVLNPALAQEFDLPDAVGGYPLRRVLGYAYWWMHFPVETVWGFTRRLHIPGQIEKVISQAALLALEVRELAGKKPSQVVDLLEQYSTPAILAVKAGIDDSPALAETITKYLQEWSHIHPSIHGTTLRAMGLPPGPHYSGILKTLRHAWLDREIKNTEEEHALLEKLISEIHSDDVYENVKISGK